MGPNARAELRASHSDGAIERTPQDALKATRLCPTTTRFSTKWETTCRIRSTGSGWNSQPTVRTFANRPELVATHVSDKDVDKTDLSPKEVGTVIFAVSREVHSKYEWHDYVIAALKRAGMTVDDVLAILTGPLKLEPLHAAPVEYAFVFVREYGEVSDARYERLLHHYDRSTDVGITMLAGYYIFLHHVVSALGLELKEEFGGGRGELLSAQIVRRNRRN